MEPDEALAARAAGGDEAAFRALVERHQRPLLNFAYRMLGDRDEAADAAQQAFVRLYLHLPGLRTDLPFRPWLYRVARNLCLDRLRARRAVALPEPDDDEADPGLVDPSPLPETVAERHDLQRLLGQAIAALPERYRAVVALRYTTDLTFAEIGAALGLPENTVKTHFQRAKALLREWLREAAG